MAKMAKKANVSPEKQAQADLEAQVLQMLGENDGKAVGKDYKATLEAQSGRYIAPYGHYGNNPNLEQKAHMQMGIDDGGDGYYAERDNTMLDELGEAALEMPAAELFETMGMKPTPLVLSAMEKLEPAERIEILRMTAGEPYSQEQLAEMAEGTAARRPTTSVKDQQMMDDAQMQLLQQLGVQ